MKRFRNDAPNYQNTLVISSIDESKQVDNSSENFNNNYYFYSEVDSNSACRLAKEFGTINYGIDGYKQAFDFDSGHINLHIQSQGGDMFAGLGIVDIVLASKYPVYSYIEGCAASAATLFSVAAKKRFIGKNSFVLIHQMSTWYGGPLDKMVEHVDNCNKFMEIIKSIYMQYTKLPEETLDTLLSKDLWLSSKECLEYGVVDEII